MKFTFVAIIFFLAAPAFAIDGPEMIMIKGGTFQMGNPNGKKDARPVHTVQLHDFFIGKFEITQALWHELMQGNTPDCMTCPVYDISIDSILAFITKLNQLTGKNYRLPTETEWEYAATGGSKSLGYKYSGSNNLDEVAWFADNAGKKTHPVGQKKPNELGLYDMSGNVWELCSDWYEKLFYSHSQDKDPINTSISSYRVSRGGSWLSPEERCQSRARNKDIHDHHIGNGGFRLVMDL